jgi:hypothetical protein
LGNRRELTARPQEIFNASARSFVVSRRTAVTAPKEKLENLLELAARGDGVRVELAHEIADLLLNWPAEYSDGARIPFEALLEKTLQDVGRPTRVAIAARFARSNCAPVELLNQLFFSAAPEMKDDIISRNASGLPSPGDSVSVEDETLLTLARSRQNALPAGLARVLGVAEDTAEEILRDVSGQSLAIACKGAHAGRATFSALAVLSDRSRAAEDSYLRLAAYDSVPQSAAESLLAFWRHKAGTLLSEIAAE